MWMIISRNTLNTDDKILMIREEKTPKKNEYDHKKRVFSILNEIRESMLGFYTHHEVIFKLKEKY